LLALISRRYEVVKERGALNNIVAGPSSVFLLFCGLPQRLPFYPALRLCKKMVESMGIEPTTSGLQSPRSPS
jgi:hypothetical protein